MKKFYKAESGVRLLLGTGFIAIAIYGGYIIGSSNSDNKEKINENQHSEPLQISENVANKENIPTTRKLEVSSLSFQRKQECAKYSTKIESIIDKNRKEDPSYSGSIKEIFYSPKVDSCLYIITDFFVNAGGKIVKSEVLSDVLTSEILLMKFNFSSTDEVKEYDKGLLLYR